MFATCSRLRGACRANEAKICHLSIAVGGTLFCVNCGNICARLINLPGKILILLFLGSVLITTLGRLLQLPKSFHYSRARKLWAIHQFRPRSAKQYLYHKTSASQYAYYSKQAEKWCRTLPAIGFNSANFDINLIREYLLPQLLTTRDEEQQGDDLNNISCIKKNNSYMSVATSKLHFLDIMHYLAAGSSYENFVKAYAPQIKQVKCPFPYKWLDSVHKLPQGLPGRAEFYNDLKNMELSEADYAGVQQLWADNNFSNMAQYLEYYNKLDVTGFVAAVEAYKAWWTKQDIDPFKQGTCV